MIEIIPAVMPETFKELMSDVGRVRGLASWVQIDVMDGMFTNSISWPYAPGSRQFEKIVADEAGMPFWDEVNYEIDLMVNNPAVEAPKWLLASAGRLVLHNKSLMRGDGRAIMEEIKSRGVEVVLAIRPSEPIEEIDQYVDLLDGVQCMGIEQVGFQGEPFEEGVLAQIAAIRAKYPDMPISVDGGVDNETAPLLVQAGATRLVSGSFIFTSEDAKASIVELQKISTL